VILQTTDFVKDRVNVVPFGGLPHRLNRLNWELGVAANSNDPALVAARDSFVSWMDQVHPMLNGSQVPFFTAGMQQLVVPAASSVIRKFDSAAALDDYVGNSGYGSDAEHPRLYGCIVFEKAAPDW
jgi:hypothetical protein